MSIEENKLWKGKAEKGKERFAIQIVVYENCCVFKILQGTVAPDYYEVIGEELRNYASHIQSLYEQSQSRLSHYKQLAEAADEVIMTQSQTGFTTSKEREAYGKYQLLKSSTQQTETKSTE